MKALYNEIGSKAESAKVMLGFIAASATLVELD